MAAPLDDAVFFDLVSNIAKTQYGPEFLNQTQLRGAMTNRLFKPNPRAVGQLGVEYKIKTGPADSTRASGVLYSDFPTSGSFSSGVLQIRVNQRDKATNDMTKFTGSVRVGEFERTNASDDGAIARVVDELMRDAQDGYAFKSAASHHLPRTGLIATVNGTAKANDKPTMAAASNYGAGATSCRVFVKGGSAACFKVGYLYDLYNAAVLVANKVVCTDVNVVDTGSSAGSGVCSVGFAVTGETTATNLDGVVDGVGIYFTDQKDANPYSFGEWLRTPANAGEPFVGNKDRLAVGNRYLLPTSLRVGETSTVRINKQLMDSLFTQLSYLLGDNEQNPGVMIGDQKLIDSLIDDIGQSAMVSLATTANAEQLANMGFKGLVYHHPIAGQVAMMGDPLALPNTMRFIRPDDWERLHYGKDDLTWLPGESGTMFRNIPSATPGAGASMFWAAYFYVVLCYMCKYPSRQATIEMVQA